MSQPRRRSASAARRMGDSFQDLVALNECLRALSPVSSIVHIGLEADNAGNLDDIVVTSQSGDVNRYIQIKLTVTPEPCNLEWLMGPSNNSGRSLLQRMYASYQSIRDPEAQAELVTVREASTTDPVFGSRDNKTGRIDDTVANDPALLERIVAHLDASAEDILSFLESTRFTTGFSYTHAEELVRARLEHRCMNNVDTVIKAARTVVNDWIQSGIRTLTHDIISSKLGPFLVDRMPAATLVIEAIDRDMTTQGADVALDWMWAFPGDNPFERRRATNNDVWNKDLWPELKGAASRLKRAQGGTIGVGGSMRLASWFAAGAALTHVSDTEIVCLRGPLWSSTDTPIGTSLVLDDDIDVDQGTDIAVAVGITTSITADVLADLRQKDAPVKRLYSLTPPDGSGNHAVASGGHAVTYAQSIRDFVRDKAGSRTTHLYMAAPAGLALLAGHFWNHTPPTQLYEPIGSGLGYEPAFLIGRR